MKVNSLGIQAYRDMIQTDRPPAERPQTSVDRPADSRVVIEPQESGTRSALAVKAPSGSYADMLSVEERRALDTLFAKFSDTARFGGTYRAEGTESKDQGSVGRHIDVRV